MWDHWQIKWTRRDSGDIWNGVLCVSLRYGCRIYSGFQPFPHICQTIQAYRDGRQSSMTKGVRTAMLVNNSLCTPEIELLALSVCPCCLTRRFPCVHWMWHHPQLCCCQATNTPPCCIHGDFWRFKPTVHSLFSYLFTFKQYNFTSGIEKRYDLNIIKSISVLAQKYIWKNDKDGSVLGIEIKLEMAFKFRACGC